MRLGSFYSAQRELSNGTKHVAKRSMKFPSVKWWTPLFTPSSVQASSGDWVWSVYHKEGGVGVLLTATQWVHGGG
jgi:hypothetical protein